MAAALTVPPFWLHPLCTQSVGEAGKKIADLLDKPQRIHDVVDVTTQGEGDAGSSSEGVKAAAVAGRRLLVKLSRRMLASQLHMLQGADPGA